MMDYQIGRIIRAVDESGQGDNTLIILTSDNGCSNAANFEEMAAKGHHPSYVFRGAKTDLWEGGHRVPFLPRWPERVKAGSVYNETVCLNDLMATCADMLAVTLPDHAGVDSVSILPALLGTDDGPLRDATVHHSYYGYFAIRQGKWKLLLSPNSGGWSKPRPGKEPEGAPKRQLYDLSVDIGEQNNLQDQYPEVVERLEKLLKKYIHDGRSTPGASQKNGYNL